MFVLSLNVRLEGEGPPPGGSAQNLRRQCAGSARPTGRSVRINAHVIDPTSAEAVGVAQHTLEMRRI